MMEPERRRARRPGPHLRAAGHPGRDLGADDLAAGLLRLLRPAGRGQGAALRLRPPLLGQRDRRGARALPQQLPALARARAAADLPDRQRRRRADRRRRPTGWPCRSCWRCSRCAPAARWRPQRLVEEAEQVELPEAHRGLLDAMRARWVIGDPDRRAAEIARAGGDVRRGRGDGAPGRRRLRRDPARRRPRARADAAPAGRLSRIRLSTPFGTKLACRPNVGLLRGASRLPGSSPDRSFEHWCCARVLGLTRRHREVHRLPGSPAGQEVPGPTR